MNWIKHSIRNMLLIVSGTGSHLLFASFIFGIWLAWNSFQHY